MTYRIVDGKAEFKIGPAMFDELIAGDFQTHVDDGLFDDDGNRIPGPDWGDDALSSERVDDTIAYEERMQAFATALHGDTGYQRWAKREIKKRPPVKVVLTRKAIDDMLSAVGPMWNLTSKLIDCAEWEPQARSMLGWAYQLQDELLKALGELLDEVSR
jgi:hypothetical protein